MRHTPLTLAVLLAASPSLAGQELVANLNQLPDGVGTNADPEHLMEVGGRLYFTATTLETGRELWFLDGSGAEPQLLADIVPGPTGSDPIDLFEFAPGTYLFTATTPENGREVWVTDGTTEGTQLLTDARYGPLSSKPAGFAVIGDRAYFTATGHDYPRSLWETDGTPEGTKRIRILPTDTDEYFTSWERVLAFEGDIVVFFVRAIAQGSQLDLRWQLFRTDGSPTDGTVLAEHSFPNSSWVTPPILYQDMLFFGGSTYADGSEPWVSDGTVEGTKMLIDLYPGDIGSSPAELTIFEDRVWFAGTHPDTGRELVSTDGSFFGTLIMCDLSPFTYSSSPASLTVGEGRLYFSAFSQQTGRELWVSDGAIGDATLMADVRQGSASSFPSEIGVLDGNLYYRAVGDFEGDELVIMPADGEGGGFEVVDLDTDTSGSKPRGMVPFGSEMYFSAYTGDTGRELFRSRGSAAETSLAFDLAASGLDQSSYPANIVSLGDVAVFFANKGVAGNGLWRTDGTEAGTWELVSLSHKTGLPVSPQILRLGSRAIFPAYDGSGSGLWITDGTKEGTKLIKINGEENLASPELIGIHDGEVYFGAWSSGLGRELFATDGTDAGTRMVADIAPGSIHSNPYGGISIGERLYFSAWTPSTGRELWSTDGTSDGTLPLPEIAAASTSGVGLTELVAHKDGFVYRGSSTIGDDQVWFYDIPSGTHDALTNFSHPGANAPSDFVSLGDRLIFRAYPAVGTAAVFSQSGNAVTQLTSAGFTPGDSFVTNGTHVFFLGRDASDSSMVVATDGTTYGTTTLSTLAPGNPSIYSGETFRASSGQVVIFAAESTTQGLQYWRTDGTTAGTYPITTLPTVQGLLAYSELTRHGDHLLFEANGKLTGVELFRLPIAALDDWVAEPFGAGCEGTLGVPVMSASGSASLGGTLDIELDDAWPLGVAHLFMSLESAVVPVSGCEVYLPSSFAIEVRPTDGAGHGVFPCPIPAQAAIAGLPIWAQWLVEDPGGAIHDAFSTSPALEIVLGQ